LFPHDGLGADRLSAGHGDCVAAESSFAAVNNEDRRRVAGHFPHPRLIEKHVDVFFDKE
jgi:hypothetical protein